MSKTVEQMIRSGEIQAYRTGARPDGYVLIYGDRAILIYRSGQIWKVEISNPITGEELTTETDTLDEAVAVALMIAGGLQREERNDKNN